MKKIIMGILLSMIVMIGRASDHTTRVGLASSLLYERGLDATLSVERETRYHNSWEYFANVYLKWDECESCGHVCPESFWNNYNTWALGIAYKPSVFRGKNVVGSLRIGASCGSNTHKVVTGIHVGYEHNYNLRNGITLFWTAKSDIMIEGEDLFRTGIGIGIKL